MPTEIRSGKIELDVNVTGAGGTQPMPTYLATPPTPGPHPAIIVLEEIFGVNSYIRSIADRLAKEGYVAIAPDYHHRVAAGRELGYDDADHKKGMEVIQHLTAAGLRADLDATLAFLRTREDVRSDRIGCIGFCIGGHAAYLAATETEVRATASFYGGGIATFSPGGGPPTITKTPQIKGRILCLFGGEDPSIKPEHVEAIRAALVEHQVRGEVVVYPKAGHGFFCDQRGSYDPQASADAWERVKKLFAEELQR